MQSVSAAPICLIDSVPIHQDYVRGNNFLRMCDHVLTIELNRTMIDSLKIFLEKAPHIKENDFIFCKNEFVISEGFEKVLFALKNPVHLVIHKGDFLIHHRWLDHPRVRNVFCSNLNSNLFHSQFSSFHPLPYGFAHPEFEGWPQTSKQQMDEVLQSKPAKTLDLYVPYHDEQNRFHARDSSVRIHFCEQLRHALPHFRMNVHVQKEKLSYSYHYGLLQKSKYAVVIPGPGWGNDGVRVWECLLRGTVPIMKRSWEQGAWHSGLEYLALQHNLPMVFVDDWMEIEEKQICKKQMDFSNVSKALKQDYWTQYMRKKCRTFGQKF